MSSLVTLSNKKAAGGSPDARGRMRRLVFPVLAVIALACAASGVWLGGLRKEDAIARTLQQLPRLSDTPFFRCADSFYWASYARDMVDTGTWRVRYTHLDNAPYGRPNYGWASLNAWYLVVLGKIWSVGTGIPWRNALLPAALWSAPILYLLALVTILLAGYLSGNFPAAAAAAFFLATAPRVYDDFAYAVPGHHGWHDLACFGTLVCLASAMRANNDRRWFFAAGLGGAIAVWIGATQQGFGLAAAGLGVVAGLILSRFLPHRHRSPASLPPAESWRLFGATGAVAAIVFYLIEYGPGPLNMRLEVNHPIYALGFLLGGEFLCRFQRLLFSPEPRDTGDLWVAGLTAGGLIGIVVAVLLGPAEWHTMRQPFMQRLHQEIAEFQPVARSGNSAWWLILGAPIFLVGVAGWRSLARDQPARHRTALLICACPCAVAIGLSFVQLRWAGIAGASTAALAAVLFADPENSKTPRHQAISPLQAICVFLSLGLIAIWSGSRIHDDARQLRAETIDRMATMEVASLLQTDARIAKPIAVFSGQKERQAWINFVTGIDSVGSLYWDSPRGIRAEAEFLATYDDAAAHRIARTRGINYVVVTPDGGDVVAYHYMWHGNRTAPQIRQTLAYRLAAPRPTPPSWLQLLPSVTPAMRYEDIRVYRVL